MFGAGISLDECGYGIRIYNCTFNVTSPTDAASGGITPAVNLDESLFGTATVPGLIYNNVLNGGSHGMILAGTPTQHVQYVQIYGNTIHHTTLGSDFPRNSYGIMISGGDHCLVHDNIVKGHGQGILLDGEGLGGSNYNEIYSNTIDVSEPTTGEFNRCIGLKVRYSSHDNLLHRHVTVRDVGSVNQVCAAFVLVRAPNDQLCYNNTIYDNTFTCLYNRGQSAYASGMDIRDVLAGNVIRNNTVTSNCQIVNIYESSHNPVLAKGIPSSRDRIPPRISARSTCCPTQGRRRDRTSSSIRFAEPASRSPTHSTETWAATSTWTGR